MAAGYTARIDSEVLTAELTDAFCKMLTDSRRSIFTECLIEGKSQSAYAAEHGISVPMVNKQIRAIREKAKIYFSRWLRFLKKMSIER